MTILELLDSTAKYFAKYQVPSPRLTIELLLAEILQKTRMQLYLEYENSLPESVLDRLRPLVKRRAEGEPLEYLLGVTTFAGHRFQVTPDVLIPRPETELLLEEILPRVEPEGLPILDVGTGSGILACSLARKFPKISVFAVDLSPAALLVAQKNGADLCNISFLPSDLLSNIELPPQFQIMVANLPYIPSAQLPTLMREVQHEPKLALDGGAEGLDIIQQLVKQSVGRTQYLALEFGDGQTQAIQSLCQAAGYAITQIVSDFTKRDRILVAKYNG